MPEEHFMINLCYICDEANVPVDHVDKIVGVICDAQNNGLNLESNVICSQNYFLKHMIINSMLLYLNLLMLRLKINKVKSP